MANHKGQNTSNQIPLDDQNGSIPRNTCVAFETALRDLSGTTRQTDIHTPDKVIPICRYASQATQK